MLMRVNKKKLSGYLLSDKKQAFLIAMNSGSI